MGSVMAATENDLRIPPRDDMEIPERLKTNWHRIITERDENAKWRAELSKQLHATLIERDEARQALAEAVRERDEAKTMLHETLQSLRPALGGIGYLADTAKPLITPKQHQDWMDWLQKLRAALSPLDDKSNPR